MIPQAIHAALAGGPLDPELLRAALERILAGDAGQVETAGLLVALSSRPPSGAELAAAATVLRDHGVPLGSELTPLVDLCGTGGDGAGTFNVSTAAAFVVAAAGAGVAKHGNRGVSSKVGSADVLEALGAPLDLDPHAARRLLDATGFVFLFAATFHPCMARVAGVRRALGVRTFFNLLGPLVNPARAQYQLLGVYDPALARPMAEALRELGSRGALVVHCDGLDELGLHASSRGVRLIDGRLEPFELSPADVGLAAAPVEALALGAGDDREAGAHRLRAALGGDAGPTSDVVALNAGVLLHVAGLCADPREGVARAQELMSSGRSLRVLERYLESCARELGVPA